MSDTTIITTIAIDSGIVAGARRQFVKGLKGTNDVLQGYADALCMTFNVRALETGAPITPWFELKGKDAKGVKAERALFVTDMTEAGFGKGTVDVYWQRVKEASGYVTAGNRAKGGKSVDEKNLAELKTIINRILSAEESGSDTEWSEVKGELIDVFEQMGGEVDALGK